MEIKLKSSNYITKANYNNVLKNLLDFNLGSTLTDIVSFEPSPETNAFLLLFNTTKRTFVELIKITDQKKIDKNKKLVIESILYDIELKNMLEEEIILTPEFFDDITYHNPNYLVSSYKIFEKFLNQLNIDVSENLNYQYFYLYRKNLDIEFNDSKTKYNALINFFINPIHKENIKFTKLLDHYIQIKKNFTDFLHVDSKDSKETLKDLYIEPFFNIYRRNVFNQQEINDNFFETSTEDFSVHDFIIDFFLEGKKINDFKDFSNMLFVLGQPGQGKTSFCYKVVYDYLENSSGLPKIPVVFVKIRDLHTKSFIENPFEAVNNFTKLDINFDVSKCFLILDGLDEAFMTGGLNDIDLRNLYERLNKTAKANSSLRIVLTSRLNYLKLTDSCIDGSIVIQLRTLSKTQIFTYADKFKLFYPENKFVTQIDKIFNEPKYYHVVELLQQAVLIYFIAVADIDIDEKDSKSILFNKIFSSLAKRSWDKNGQLSYIKSDLRDNYEKYERLLKSYIKCIAFEIYQSKNLHITVEKLQSLDATTNFIRKCFDGEVINDSNHIKEISKYLLISFYFQETRSDNSSDTAVEFFHNSLWENLTADYLWEENKKILLSEDNDGDLVVLNKEDYFKFLNKMVGNKVLNPIIRYNLEDIIEREDNEVKIKIFHQSKKLFDALLQLDFLIEYSSRSNENNLTIMEKSVSIFELFWTFYSKSNVNNSIKTNEKLNLFLFTLSTSFYAEYSFRNIIFSDDMFHTKYFEEITFDNVSFDRVYLNYVNISNNEFNNVIFRAYFSNVVFQDNEFDTVEFYECVFNERTLILDNKFKKLKLNNCRVFSVKFLSEILKNNDVFDEDFLDNHTITKVNEDKRRQSHTIPYLITYIGN